MWNPEPVKLQIEDLEDIEDWTPQDSGHKVRPLQEACTVDVEGDTKTSGPRGSHGPRASVSCSRNDSVILIKETTQSLTSAELSSESDDTSPHQNNVRAFATLLIERLLTKCHALDIWTRESVATHTEHLVSQLLRRLDLSEVDTNKSIKKICSSVINDLQEQYGGKRQLEKNILTLQPSVDAAIVECLRNHIMGCSEAPAKKKKAAKEQKKLSFSEKYEIFLDAFPLMLLTTVVIWVIFAL